MIDGSVLATVDPRFGATAPENAKPTMKATRQDIPERRSSTPAQMPLIPASRPLLNRSTTVAAPMSTPPRSEAHGVKLEESTTLA